MFLSALVYDFSMNRFSTLTCSGRSLVNPKNTAALSARELGFIRVAIEGHVRKHGASGSEQHAAHRAIQRRVAGLLTDFIKKVARSRPSRTAMLQRYGGDKNPVFCISRSTPYLFASDTG